MNKQNIIKAIKKTTWFKFYGKENLETYSDQGLLETLRIAASYNPKADYKLCKKCHKNFIYKHCTMCQDCLNNNYVEKEVKRKAKDKRNLDVSLLKNSGNYYTDRGLLLKKIKERSQDKYFDDKKMIWENNFKDAFPSYASYVHFLSANRLNWADKVAISIAISEYDKIIQRFEKDCRIIKEM